MNDADKFSQLNARLAKVENRTGMAGVETRGKIKATHSGNNLVLDVTDLEKLVASLESRATAQDKTIASLTSAVTSLTSRLNAASASGTASLALNCASSPPTISGNINVTLNL